jgi:3-methyladenine DNA glycosylase AlkD
METVFVKEIRSRLHKLGDRQKAQFLQGFFKTGPGGYGEGDIFLGIRVPEIRELSSKYKTLTTQETLPMLRSPIHEERLLALLLLIRAFSKGDDPVRKQIYRIYLDNTQSINNWDLVDISAPHIVGAFLIDKSKKPLYQLAKSNNLWERRIAIMATFHFIRDHQFSEALRISKILLLDKEDLIHKAVGWMLREIGKRDMECEELFLKEHYKQMPRTMLRYAIEKFPPSKRRMYLNGAV